MFETNTTQTFQEGLSNTDSEMSTAPSTRTDTGSGFVEWSPAMFDMIGGLGTAYFNSEAGYQTGAAPGSYGFAPVDPGRNNNMLLIGGIILLAMLIYFLKK